MRRKLSFICNIFLLIIVSSCVNKSRISQIIINDTTIIKTSTSSSLETATTISDITPTPYIRTSTSIPSNLLSRSIYYIQRENNVGQIFRLNPKFLSITQITYDSIGVQQFDISLADGTIAYVTESKLILTDSNGQIKNVLVGQLEKKGLAWPVWSPNGLILAYNNSGLYLYFLKDNNQLFKLDFNENSDSYIPVLFSPDNSKILLDNYCQYAIYYIYSKELVPLVPPNNSWISCGKNFSWSADSNYLYLYDYQLAGGGTSLHLPGLWRFDMEGKGINLFTQPSQYTDFNRIAAVWQEDDGSLIYLFSPSSNTFDEFKPFSLVRSEFDGITNRITLRPESFFPSSSILWALDGSFIIVIQHENGNNRNSNMILIPIDPKLNITTLMTDTSMIDGKLLWGP